MPSIFYSGTAVGVTFQLSLWHLRKENIGGSAVGEEVKALPRRLL